MRIFQEGDVNERGDFIVGKANGTFRVVERKENDVWIIISPAHGAGVIEIPDFTMTIEGRFIGLEYAENQPVNVYLSPKDEFIVVDKHLDSTMEVCNVYRRRGNRAEMILVDNLRFDEACVRFYCKLKNIPLHQVNPGGRYCFLMGWQKPHTAIFDVASSGWGFSIRHPDRSIFFRVQFDFARGHFTHAAPIWPF